MKKIIQFFKDSYAELKKVIWPSKSEVASVDEGCHHICYYISQQY